MRPALLPTLTLIVLLATGCGGSGGGDTSNNVIQDPPAPPQDGVQGRVSSRIAGASLSVIDADGEEIVLASGRTTNPNGTYSLVFSEFEIEEGIRAPLIVSLSGSNATAVCDFDREGANDCLDREGSFVAFGETYNLPADFSLRGVAASFPPEGSSSPRTITVNLSAASDLAAHYALNANPGAALAAPDIELGKARALGIVEFVTGLNTAGRDLNNISITDLTVSGNKTTPELAVALFNASLHGQINTDLANQSSYRRVLNRLANNAVPLLSSATDQLRSTGAFMASAVAAFVTTATNFLAALETPSAVITGAVAGQASAVTLLEQIGNNRVLIALPADPASSEPLDQTRIFVGRLSEAIGSALQVSQTAAFGGTPAGARSVYEEQLRLVTTLTSLEMLNTFEILDDALATALADNVTELTGTNVTGSLSFDGDTVNIATATSTTSNIQTGISVNITVTDGSRINPGGAGSFSAGNISINVSQTLNNLTTQQRYNGVIELLLDSSGSPESIDYTGTLRATSALNFEGSITAGNLVSDSGTTSGSYDARFTFADGSELAMLGLLEAEIASYTVTTSSSTVAVDLQTRSITDMTSSLNLSVDSGGTVTGGTFESGGIQTGTMDTQGTVTFSDGTATALPAPVI